MKSIEEKAKRFDELLIKAQQIYNKENDVLILHTIEDLLPELKESEDERIRKSITEFFKNFSKNGTWKAIPDVTKWIAWLEKQGKNNIGISEATKKKLEDNLNKALEKETPESWNEFLDKGEQKPAWSEEDEEKMNWIIATLNNCSMRNSECVPMNESCEDWLKSLKDKLQPQQKQEWSEEDVAMLNFVTLILQRNKYDDYFTTFETSFEDCISWFKSLKNRVQLKKEWNSGDEAHLHSLITHLEQWIERHPNTTGADIQGENIAWLKSLRPQNTWKPSEEQIKALLKLEEMHVLEHEKNQENAHLYMVVKSIREQLLKLREE